MRCIFLKRLSIFTLLLGFSLVLCSCSNDDSSSGSTSSNEAEQASASASASDDTAASSDNSDTLARQLSDNLDLGEYAIDMVISGDGYDSAMPCKMTAKDGSGFVSMTVSGVYTEFYTVDGVTYMLMPDIACYEITGDEGSFSGNAFVKVSDDDVLTDTYTEDGRITEVFSSLDSDGSTETYTFVFDEEELTLISLTAETADGTTLTEINSISLSGVDIELPDLSGWQNVSDTDSVDDVTYMKLTLYYMGITEEMVEEAGYTFDEIAAMDESELNDLLSEMGVDIYG